MLDVFADPIWRVFRNKFFEFGDDRRGMDMLLNDGRASSGGAVPVRYYDGHDSFLNYDGYDRRPGWGGLDVRLLDQTEVVSGHLLLDRSDEYKRGLQQLEDKKRKRIAVHFNWDTTRVSKEDGAKQMGFWFLDNEGIRVR